MYIDYYHTPIGPLKMVASDAGLQEVQFVDDNNDSISANTIIENTKTQLSRYFEGNLTEFSIPFDFQGTDFQKRVWNQLLDVPYSNTISYLQQAKKLGDEKVIRASASANGSNPIAIIVPCHRIIGTNGKLTGYAGGLWRKQWLLEFEAKQTGKLLTLF